MFYLILTYLALAALFSYWLNSQKVETSFNPDWKPSEVQQAKAYLLDKVGYKSFRKMSKVISCESGWDINAFNQKTNDSGLTQINIVWEELAKELGLDYKNSWQANIDMSLVILQKQGIRAWKASFACHRVNTLVLNK